MPWLILRTFFLEDINMSGCCRASLSFVHVLPCVVLGAGPCTLLISDQGRPTSYISGPQKLQTPDNAISGIKGWLKKKEKKKIDDYSPPPGDTLIWIIQWQEVRILWRLFFCHHRLPPQWVPGQRWWELPWRSPALQLLLDLLLSYPSFLRSF